MKIKEVYEKNKNKDVWISYTWEMKCAECGAIFEKEDEEYSVWGTLEDFETARKDYDVLDLDDEVCECRDGNGEIFYKYIRSSIHEDCCELCEKCMNDE